MNESPVTRHSLIVKLRDPADSAAWGEFLAIYEPLVYRLGRLKGLQYADARDLCEAVFHVSRRGRERRVRDHRLSVQARQADRDSRRPGMRLSGPAGRSQLLWCRSACPQAHERGPWSHVARSPPGIAVRPGGRESS